VVREGAVHVAIERKHLTAQPLEHGQDHRTGSGIPGIHADPQATGHLNIAHHEIHIGGKDIVRRGLTGAGRKITVRHEGAKALNLSPVYGVEPVADLEAVVLGRIMTGGDHDPAVPVQMADGEVENRGRHNPDVNHLKAGGQHACHQAIPEKLGAEAAVPADHRVSFLLARQVGAKSFSEEDHILLLNLFPDDAPDVVFTKGIRIH